MYTTKEYEIVFDRRMARLEKTNSIFFRWKQLGWFIGELWLVFVEFSYLYN